MQRQRIDLRIMFKDGARPTGNDFADVFDSFVHRSEDGLTITTAGAVDNFRLGTFTVAPAAGAMQFAAGQVQFFDGATWKNVGSNDLGFKPLNQQPATALPDAAYFGKIGINLGATPPPNLKDDFEVGVSNSVSKARAGTAVIGGNGPGGARAMLFHSNVRNLAVNGGNVDQNYGFAQNQNGSVFINTVTNESIIFSTNDTPQLLMRNGRLVVGSNVALTPVPSPPAIDPGAPIMLHVHGHAIKLNGGNSWLVTSDVRTKKNISDFKDGLEKLKALRPIQFCYNGKGGTKDNLEQIGLIGQEVEEVFPYMVKRMGNTPSADDETEYPENMLLLDSSPLVFILMNAIRDLDEKIELLKNRPYANA